MFNKDDAEAIATKWGASVVPKQKHDIVQFWYQNKLVGWYGIRRGSRRDASHDYVPEQMKLSPRQCRDFKDCTKNRNDIISIWREKGVVPREN